MSHNPSFPGALPGPVHASEQGNALRTGSVPARRVDIQARHLNGEPIDLQRQIPAMALFEAAFGAFARGTLLQSQHGLIAVEDLTPDDRLVTVDGRLEHIRWIGKMHYAASPNTERLPLVRLLPDAFGFARPEVTTTLGPHARVLHAPPARPDAFASGGVVTSIAAFVDGDTIIEALPPTEVDLYHLCLSRHTAVLASGLEVETFHPGLQPLKDIPQSLRPLYTGLFPHVSSLGDFGPVRYARADHTPSMAL